MIRKTKVVSGWTCAWPSRGGLPRRGSAEWNQRRMPFFLLTNRNKCLIDTKSLRVVFIEMLKTAIHQERFSALFPVLSNAA